MEEKKDIYDRCVLCGKRSPYTLYDSIYSRIGYIEGGGQGCFMPGLSCEGDIKVSARKSKIKKILAKIKQYI
ncbi:hypothetical protein EBU71_02015 [bacterium]|nr:hypothetical protein [Candidatus Elulimicrobium humile]